MKLKKYQTVFEALFISIVLYLVHKLFFVFSKLNVSTDSFNYSIETLYLFFGIFSLSTLFILIKVKQKNIDYVGYTFLLLTFIKMGMAYVLLSTILNATHQDVKLEKINFFAVFALFLAIETALTIRLLNNNQ
jgi:hypothetical protein